MAKKTILIQFLYILAAFVYFLWICYVYKFLGVTDEKLFTTEIHVCVLRITNLASTRRVPKICTFGKQQEEELNVGSGEAIS